MKDLNQHACPIKYCSWRMAPERRCPIHGKKMIENPNYLKEGEHRTEEADE